MNAVRFRISEQVYYVKQYTYICILRSILCDKGMKLLKSFEPCFVTSKINFETLTLSKKKNQKSEIHVFSSMSLLNEALNY